MPAVMDPAMVVEREQTGWRKKLSLGWVKKALAGGSCCSAGMVHSPTRERPEAAQTGSQRSTSGRERLGKVAPAPVLVQRSEDPTSEHTLFCPICMYYFGSVLKTSCCGHHLCSSCMLEMARHSVTAADDDGRSPSPDELSIESLNCPHCNAPRLRAARITGSDDARRFPPRLALHPCTHPPATRIPPIYPQIYPWQRDEVRPSCILPTAQALPAGKPNSS